MYNAGIEKVFVHALPSLVREVILPTLLKQIFAKKSYPDQTRDKLRITTRQYENDYFDRYSGSQKISDLNDYVDDEARLIADDEARLIVDDEARLIVEVGFPESYARLWIEGREISPTVILIKFIESPMYKSKLDDRVRLRLQLSNSTKVLLSALKLQEPFELVCMRELV